MTLHKIPIALIRVTQATRIPQIIRIIQTTQGLLYQTRAPAAPVTPEYEFPHNQLSKAKEKKAVGIIYIQNIQTTSDRPSLRQDQGLRINIVRQRLKPLKHFEQIQCAVKFLDVNPLANGFPTDLDPGHAHRRYLQDPKAWSPTRNGRQAMSGPNHIIHMYRMGVHMVIGLL